MTRTRSPLRAGAVVFALLSVTLHAVVWTVGREARTTRVDDVDVEPTVALRLVVPAAPAASTRPTAAPRSEPTPDDASVPHRAGTEKRASKGPAEREAKTAPTKHEARAPRARSRAAQPAAKAEPAKQAKRDATRPSAAAWSRPIVLPEFDDSIDADVALVANRTGARHADAGRPETSSGNEATAAGAAEADLAASAAAGGAAQGALAPAKAIEVVPGHGSVRYRIHYGDPADGNVVATIEQQYEIDGDRYRLHSEGRASGLASWFYRGTLVQESRGRVSSIGLQPERYSERRGEREAKEAVLDPDAERVRFASGAEAALPPGAQDRLSVFVQLGLLLHSDPSRFVPGAVVDLPVLASSRIAPASWHVLGVESVELEGSVVAALRLRREAPDDDEPTIDLWLALEPRVLPLRVRVTEASGRALDQVVVVDDR